MAAERSGDPGRTPGSAEGDRETVEQDLTDKGLNQNTNPPTSAQDVNQQRSGEDRKKTGKVTDEQDDWINKRQ